MNDKLNEVWEKMYTGKTVNETFAPEKRLPKPTQPEKMRRDADNLIADTFADLEKKLKSILGSKAAKTIDILKKTYTDISNKWE